MIYKKFKSSIESAQILLVPPNYEIIMVPSNHSIVMSNIAIAITIWVAIQKRSQEPIYKTYTNI